MSELIKIRDVSSKYDVSARTLRYYEDMGLLTSIRGTDYSYRMYDENAVRRLEQILILRKLNISIKDIQRIFNTSGSEVVLDVLGKKVNSIDEEIALLHELKEIVLDFIKLIEQVDFAKESDIKKLYDKAREVETQIVNVDYNGNPSTVNRLIEVTEKLDNKIPDIMIVKIPRFRAVTSGLESFDVLFGEFEAWQQAHNHLYQPVIFNCPDFLYGKEDKAEWIWAVKDEVTEVDTYPYNIIEFPGGLYAVAVTVDGDGESNSKVMQKIEKWLNNTNFVMDNDRYVMGHMIYPIEEIKEGLGYNQMNLYVPIKLRAK